ncbi:AtpZ/AtpI family protein [Winogradskyella sp. F6397]|uniref:AtpZ/AtpI family protein n=1 Tax=Winogradskyella marina TaxID=2785530 RepID=A0ABS0EFM2_9FLAO|nr:AtpZ/AtpI family protein [Winogradskyella marina]
MSQANHNKPQKPKTKKSDLNSYARYSSIAIQMVIIIGVGTFIGVKLDEYFPNEHKLYTLILSLSSVILSMVYVIRRIIASS